MSRGNYAKSEIFLMEFIIVVLFFALCSAVCISAFAKAENISRQSRDMNEALILAQSAAEALKAGEYQELENLKMQVEEEGRYSIEVLQSLQGDMMIGDIAVYEKDGKSDAICQIQVKKYTPEPESKAAILRETNRALEKTEGLTEATGADNHEGGSAL